MIEPVSQCHLCRSDRWREEPNRTELLRLPAPLRICRCIECGLLRLNPRYTTSELSEMYAREPFWSEESIAGFPDRRRFEASRWERFERWKPERGFLLGMACLEGGHTLANAKARGWDAVAVEFIDNLFDFAENRLGLAVRRLPFWDLEPLMGQSFDAVYTHSLEHVPDPRRTLGQFHRLLKSDGLLLMEVPNQFHSLKDVIRLGMLSVAGMGRLSHLTLPVTNAFHLYYFNPPTLRRLLAEEGFEIVSFRTYIPWHPIYLYESRARVMNELIYRTGAMIGRGPCMEVIARKRDEGR